MSPAVPTLDRTLRLALQALQAGNAQLALELATTVGLPDASLADFALVRALALSALQRTAEALPLFEQLTRWQPDACEHWSNFGNALCELGREGEALQPLLQAVALGADDIATHFALARSHCRLGDVVAAERHIRLARQYDPQNADMHLLHARIALVSDRIDQARPLLNELRASVLSPMQRSDLGFLELRAGQYTESRQSFESAILALPDDVEAKIGLSLTLERSNKVEAARSVRAELTPEIAKTLSPVLAAKLLQVDARLHVRSGDQRAAQACLRKLLATDELDPALRADLGFALGRSLDKTGECDAAMRALADAHAIRRDLVGSSHPELLGRDDLLSALRRDPPEHPVRCASKDGFRDPVFLVGFPRSGTTLLEQLLDAHVELRSFDEQAFLQHLIDRLRDRGHDFPEALATLDLSQMGDLRRQYADEVSALIGKHEQVRLVDKNPLNLARLPLVDSVFPEAHVLLALRHPCDVVLSCYMQSFQAPAFALTFETLAKTARMYAEVMAFWLRIRSRLRVPVHVLRYEELVADVEGEARRLFAFLGLAWSDELLNFTERAARKGAIGTPSYADVTRPVSSRAVGRWRRYRACFEGEVLDILAPYLSEFGYSVD